MRKRLSVYEFTWRGRLAGIGFVWPPEFWNASFKPTWYGGKLKYISLGLGVVALYLGDIADEEKRKEFIQEWGMD